MLSFRPTVFEICIFAADPMERQATEGMINNFGQTPCQLLREPHPKRLTFDEATRKYANIEGRLLNVFHYTKYLKAFLVEVSERLILCSFFFIANGDLFEFKLFLFGRIKQFGSIFFCILSLRQSEGFIL